MTNRSPKGHLLGVLAPPMPIAQTHPIPTSRWSKISSAARKAICAIDFHDKTAAIQNDTNCWASVVGVGEAVEDRNNEYGVFYQVVGELVGTNGINLFVVTIWIQRRIDGKFQFVTLKPLKET